mgnify:CR=1 FL=1
MEVISSDYITRALISFVSVLIVLGAVAWWLKTKGTALGTLEGDQIRVLSRVQIDNRHKILIVEVGDSRFLIGTSPTGIAINPLAPSISDSDFDDLYKSQLENHVK